MNQFNSGGLRMWNMRCLALKLAAQTRLEGT